MSPGRGRVKSGPGRIQWLALVSAAAVVMGLTFTLGVLVGRQWSRPGSVSASAENFAKKIVPPGKRGGLSGADVEQAPGIDQKLTFYQTLTAPLGRGSADASQRPEDKTKAPPVPERARAEPPPPSYSYASRAETVVEKPEASLVAATRAQTDPALWSVQVAAFKTQAQAAALQQQLKKTGFDAYVASAPASDGQTNYRVRIGTFKSKADAQSMAERVRSERSLAAFVAPR
ncbi:MAG TPA: SPOR domain-containing protein [Methylomirabilota bacterium]